MRRFAYYLCLVAGLLIVFGGSVVHAKVYIGVSSTAWSPDGKQIAFSFRNGDEGVALYVADYDGSNPVKLVDGAEYPAWSPDGTRIAYVVWPQNLPTVATSHLAENTNVIYTINPDGSERTRIAEGYSPAWSPDGQEIGYLFDEALYVANADGSDARQLFHQDNRYIWSFEWSPDGTQIAVASSGEYSEWAQLVLMNSDGTNQRTLSEGVGSMLSWSPDSRQLTFAGRCGADGKEGLCVGEVSASDESAEFSLLVRHGKVPRWSPDGKQIAFMLGNSVCLIDADGANQNCLTKSMGYDWLQPAAWSPDSQMLLIQRPYNLESSDPNDFRMDVLVMRVDGSESFSLMDGIKAS